MIICGIDIGNNSGVSLFDFEGTTPKIELLSLTELSNKINSINNIFIITEQIFVSPQMGRQCAISFGMNKQLVLNIIKDKIYYEIHPKSWQKYLYNYYKLKLALPKGKSLTKTFDITTKLIKAEVEGKTNEGKRTATLIAIYGIYYLLAEGIYNNIKLSNERLFYIEKNLEPLVKLKNKIRKTLIECFSEGELI